MIEATASDIFAHVESADVLVVEFSAAEPKHARSRSLENEFPDVRFCWTDPTRHTAVADTFGISSGPGLLIFRQRIGLYLEPGDHPPDKIERLLQQVLSLDMTVVRANLERERAEVALQMRRMCPAARRGKLTQ